MSDSQKPQVFSSIKNWAEDEKPREKLLLKGPSSLSDAELLTILISTGTAKRSALDLARDMLILAHNNLYELGRLGVHDLQKVKGIGQAKAITIVAAMELGRRRQMTQGIERTSIKSSSDAAEIIMPLIGDYNHEVFCALYLNHAGKLLKHEVISIGGISGVYVDIRLILKTAIMLNASQLVVGHNHPSGTLKASKNDMDVTRSLKQSADIMGMTLLDHIIVAQAKYMSMADEGLL